MDDRRYSTVVNGEWVEVPPIDELCLALKTKFERQEEQIKNLRKINDEIKEGIWEDEEVKFLKARYEEMKNDYYRGFPISKEEDKAIKEWQAKHERDVHHAVTAEERLRLCGVSGGGYTYIFVPTSIGLIGRVQCSACGEEFEFCTL